MNRRLLHRLRVRLERSALPRTDEVWLDLDAELVRVGTGRWPIVVAHPEGVGDPFEGASQWSRLVDAFRSLVESLLRRVTRSTDAASSR